MTKGDKVMVREYDDHWGRRIYAHPDVDGSGHHCYMMSGTEWTNEHDARLHNGGASRGAEAKGLRPVAGWVVHCAGVACCVDGCGCGMTDQIPTQLDLMSSGRR
jgi:hypothetical protein